MSTFPVNRVIPSCLAGVCLATMPVRAAESGSGSSGTHVLFMGADLAVQQGKKFYRVEDVDGSEFVITVGEKSRFVRTRLQSNHLKINPALKISPVSVRLDELQGGPGYTPANDPRHKFNARSGAQGGAQAARDWAETRHNEAVISLEAAKAGPSTEAFKKNYEDIIVAEGHNMAVAGQHLGSDLVSLPNMANALALELAEGNYDMVDVSFKVSSPEPLDDPYMVVLVEFSPRDAKPGETSMLIHAKALDPIGPEPKYVRMREAGLPIGFKFERFEVRIYNRGQEVATNTSPKRVELTHAEAQQYLLMDHLAAHKSDSVPASAVPGSLPPGWRARLSPEQLQRVCYARVSKEGALLGVYADAGASLPLGDEQIVTALAGSLFKPALHQGRPLDGVAEVRLADLTL